MARKMAGGLQTPTQRPVKAGGKGKPMITSRKMKGKR